MLVLLLRILWLMTVIIMFYIIDHFFNTLKHCIPSLYIFKFEINLRELNCRIILYEKIYYHLHKQQQKP